MKSRAALAIEIFTKKNVARQDLGNRATAVSPGSREEVPKQQRGKKLTSPTSCTVHGEGRMNYLIVTYPLPPPPPLSLSLWYQYLGHSYSHERLAGQPRGKTDLINILLNTMYYVNCTFCCNIDDPYKKQSFVFRISLENSQSKTQTADCRPADLGKIQITDCRLLTESCYHFHRWQLTVNRLSNWSVGQANRTADVHYN